VTWAGYLESDAFAVGFHLEMQAVVGVERKFDFRRVASGAAGDDAPADVATVKSAITRHATSGTVRDTRQGYARISGIRGRKLDH
jgi:hypothetical protein